MTATNTLHMIWLIEEEKVESFSGERDPASAGLHEVFSALQKTIKAPKDKKIKAADMLA